MTQVYVSFWSAPVRRRASPRTAFGASRIGACAAARTAATDRFQLDATTSTGGSRISTSGPVGFRLNDIDWWPKLTWAASIMVRQKATFKRSMAAGGSDGLNSTIRANARESA